MQHDVSDVEIDDQCEKGRLLIVPPAQTEFSGLLKVPLTSQDSVV